MWYPELDSGTEKHRLKKGLGQCALQCWQMPVSAFREIESSLFIG